MSIFDGQFRERQSGLLGSLAAAWQGNTAPDGDAYPWIRAGRGSLYLQVGSGGETRTWQKVETEGQDDDWAALGGLHVISQRVAIADFTDGGSTVGTLVLAQGIPAGAVAVRTYLLNVTGFTGDTSATLQVGDGSTADRYSTGTPSIFTTAAAIDMGAVSGTAIHTVAKSVTLTVTSNSDFAAVTAGAMTVRILYYL